MPKPQGMPTSRSTHSQDSIAPSDPPGAGPSASAGQRTAGGSPLHFMSLPVHNVLHCTKAGGRPPQHQGAGPHFLKALSNPAHSSLRSSFGVVLHKPAIDSLLIDIAMPLWHRLLTFPLQEHLNLLSTLSSAQPLYQHIGTSSSSGKSYM